MSKRKGSKIKASPSIGKTKDSSQFLEALKLYEGKQYKKSLKILETILKKDSSNVDALALKGMNLSSTGEKEDAEIYVNNAIKKINGTSASPIACHVLGIYMRSNKRYSESIKWFQSALDNGSSNQQIYRDLSTLQSQVGDFKSVLISRRKYWESFMGYRANWTSYAIAQDINGEFQQAVNTLSQFEKLSEGKLGEAEMYENNECLIYKNDIMYRAAGSQKDKLENVLKHLNQIEPNVFDKYSVLERKASIYMKIGELKEAAKVYRTLIKRNPDNFSYYKLLEVALGITGNNQLRKAFYERMAKFYPRCEPPKYTPLTFITDEDELSKYLENYVIPQLERGVPATFTNIKPLYKKRGAIVQKLAENIVTKYFDNLDASANSVQYIWTLYFLAQHFLFVKQFQKAQEFIEKAIEHTPTMVEFYILKGRIMKHLGLLSDAADVLEEGRKIDLQDRFINCKTAKYYLRANNIEKAVEVASLFTKNDDAVNGVKDLHLVEASWFIIEQAEAYNRLHIDSKKKLSELRASLEAATDEEVSETDSSKSELKELEWQTEKYRGLALKRFVAISKFYKQFEDDQLDFHSYCMRKGTPRAYLEMLDWGKTIYTKPIYVRAMNGASKINFEIFDEHEELKLKEDENESGEIKKKNKKSKKQSASMNKRKEEEKKIVMAYPANQDDDVFGEKLIQSKTQIEDFMETFYNSYSKQVSEEDKDHVLEFEVQYRMGKLALCLGALSKYSKIHGTKAGLTGSMAIVLALSTRDSTKFETIAKKVATKGLETDFSVLPLSEVNNEEYDWVTFFKDNYNCEELKALLFLKHYKVGQSDMIKELILQRLSNCEPYLQSEILQYEL
ncbi:hypothetical protein Kpol_1032p15 [Vanderwaltozyma polyspora DSM 70294]|uniref:N-terminal acetyltransferase A complex subunit NAT1 n=1 Tax=Vanderwaltozyma polyspora (strain ATCC 22028 / DSM 70294 / BCRC 21397 / CBS 2163 / NBRC 10782 / NRRL Y-8283 / UCD 57-17) TaxID=436907 RepID=A7TGX1_VANPO|nr:uncharacterized protein Kpol_1032p15 [Vanderwaltozyma polyspora DSM 70294]EDO18423.1 hypothetical protein Kpol_1032p15 [Vanderwaltozyma polyspora DSM 70294]